MIDLARNFLAVSREGALSRAATRLHTTQPSLSRQIQALEAELGGPLLERFSTGVRPTDLGQRAVATLAPLVAAWDAAVANLRREARGKRVELRVGYLGSAAQKYLDPALRRLRKAHPEAKVRLLDLTPAEQLEALRAGEIDLALVGQEGAVGAREFHARKIATLGVLVALPEDHPLATQRAIGIAQLAGETFIAAPDDAVPGRNRWVASLCRKGGFRPRFVATGDSIGESFSLVASEGAVMLLPDYFAAAPPGTVLLPLAEPTARWDLILLRQRGKAPQLVAAMAAFLCGEP